MAVTVSIIIPTKNRANQLVRAVKSCIKQTFTDIEVIVVDDNSDSSLKASTILSGLVSDNIRVIDLSESVGGAEARNIGVNYSIGEYVTFLDSDDALIEDAIEKQLKAHYDNGKHENLITYGKAIRYRCKGFDFVAELGIEPCKGMMENQTVANYLFSGKGRMFTPTLFMRRSFFGKIKFNKNLKRHQDYGFVIDAEKKNAKFFFINAPIFYWISDFDDEGTIAKSINIKTCSSFIDYYSSSLSDKEVELYMKNILSTVAILSRDIKGYFSEINKRVKRYPVLKGGVWLLVSFIKMFKRKFF